MSVSIAKNLDDLHKNAIDKSDEVTDSSMNNSRLTEYMDMIKAGVFSSNDTEKKAILSEFAQDELKFHAAAFGTLGQLRDIMSTGATAEAKLNAAIEYEKIPGNTLMQKTDALAQDFEKLYAFQEATKGLERLKDITDKNLDKTTSFKMGSETIKLGNPFAKLPNANRKKIPSPWV